MTAPLVYPPESVIYWTTLEYACRSVLLPLRDAILNLGTKPPTSDEPDAPIVLLTPNTDSADISQFPKEKLERVQEFGKYSIDFLNALGPYLNENWSGVNGGLGSIVQKVEHVFLAVDNYLRSPEGSDCRRRATIDMCTAGRLCFAIRVSFPGMLNGISRRHDFVAYCELLNCPPNINNPETLAAINDAGATWKAETCWRKRLRALANKITAESKHGSPELSVSNLDYYSKLADPILGKAIALGELNDESGLLKQLAIKAGDDADTPRPNRPHLSLFDKLAPQLFPGVSFDKSQESAPLVLAATLERMAELEQVDSRGTHESDPQPDSGTPPPKKLDAQESSKGDSEEFIFRRDGSQYYVQGFGESGGFPNEKGFEYLYALLSSPNYCLPMRRLVSGNAANAGRHSDSDVINSLKAQSGERDGNDPQHLHGSWTPDFALDDVGRDALEDAITLLESKIADARQSGIPDEIDHVEIWEREIKRIEAQLAKDSGLFNRGVNLDQEPVRLKSRIGKAIRLAITKMKENGCATLAEYFDNARASEGLNYRLNDPTKIIWKLKK